MRTSFAHPAIFAFLAAFCLASPASAETPAKKDSQRWAILVGVDDYTEMKHLKYCGADQRAMHEQLAKAGFPADQMILLHDKASENRYKPFKANIEKQLKLLLSMVGKDDLLIFSFSGHCMQIGEKRYLCPADGSLEKPDSLIAMDDVYARIKAAPAALRLMIVDACRDDPRPRGKRSVAQIDELKDFAKAPPPEGILCLNSCGPGQQSQEDDDVKQGVFMHFLLEGWSGRAAKPGARRISLGELVDYAQDKTKKHVARKFNDFQKPFLNGEYDAEVLRFDMGIAGDPRTITNALGMKLVLIPPGEFQMGSGESAEEMVKYFNDKYSGDLEAENYQDEHPQHTVRITRSFYLGATHVTRGQFRQFVNDEGYNSEGKWRNPGFAQTDEHPVVNVSWNDAVAYCRWLSKKEGNTYRLPTEAEWEYACRAGTTTRWWNGDDAEQLAQIGNVADAALKVKIPLPGTIQASDGYVYTSPVGSFRANPYGLYDMHGNACQWCSDWYDAKYYATSSADDPSGPDSGTSRVLRGGSWGSWPGNSRSAVRRSSTPDSRSDNAGFRVARTP